MKKITILMLHFKHGGIEKQTITMANALSNKYEIEIVSLYNFNEFIAYEINPKIKIKYLLNYGSNRKELKDAISKKSLKSIVKEACKSVKVLLNKDKVLLKYLKKIKTDILISTRVEFAELISKSKIDESIITITQEHNHIENEKYGKRFRKSCKKINYAIVMSEISKKIYLKWLEGTNTKVVIIPNILESIPAKKSSCNHNAIIAAGRFHPVKNFSTLIDLFNIVHKNNKETILYLCGDGEEKEILEKKVKDLNLDKNVIFTGMVNSETLNDYMLKSDLYIMTSLHECFPMVLLEANSFGLPTLSFDVPAGPKTIIKNKKNGYLIENNNKEEMANKIINLLNEKDEIKKMSIFSRENAKLFLADEIIKKWIAIFEGGSL